MKPKKQPTVEEANKIIDAHLNALQIKFKYMVFMAMGADGQTYTRVLCSDDALQAMVAALYSNKKPGASGESPK